VVTGNLRKNAISLAERAEGRGGEKKRRENKVELENRGKNLRLYMYKWNKMEQNEAKWNKMKKGRGAAEYP
jgi:hypothetical protein